MIDRAGGDDTSSDRSAATRRPDHGSRRLVWTAIGFSAVLHLIAIAIYPVLFDRLRPEAVSFPLDPETSEPQGIELMQLVELDDSEAGEPPEEPEYAADPVVPGMRFDLPPLNEGVEVELAPPPSNAAERLRPNLTNTRLWAPLSRVLGELTPARREELLVSGRLQEWYDSVRVAEDEERALTDWTFTDDEGGRWGVSDGRIHLGDYSLPLPFDFGVTPSERAEVNRRLDQWEAIERQGRRMEIRDSWRARSEAIRERRDRERAAGDSTGGGPDSR